MQQVCIFAQQTLCMQVCTRTNKVCMHTYRPAALHSYHTLTECICDIHTPMYVRSHLHVHMSVFDSHLHHVHAGAPIYMYMSVYATCILLCMWHTFTPTHICIHTHNRSCAKIYWDGGGHDSLRDGKGSRLAPPLSKLHKQGKALLEAAGWRRTGTNTSLVPAFSWTVRQGGAVGQPGTSASSPPVRQLPQEITDLLDDKRELALTLEAGGVEEVAPETHADVRVALSWPGGAPITAQDGGEDEQEVWFLKHRRGVKGQAVTPVFSAQVPRALSHCLAVHQ